MDEIYRARIEKLLKDLAERSVYGNESEDEPFGVYDPLVAEARLLVDELAL